ncbi:hypothetical protein ACFXC9_11960 [Streptomyces naganishii]|uniref:hypothetical protein n=1 Tax=Streptomyces naganishii TaxID=285447 RepID=UPI003673B8D4
MTHRELYRRIDAVQELLEMKRRRDGSPRTTEPLGRYRHELSGVVRDLDDGLI